VPFTGARAGALLFFPPLPPGVDGGVEPSFGGVKVVPLLGGGPLPFFPPGVGGGGLLSFGGVGAVPLAGGSVGLPFFPPGVPGLGSCEGWIVLALKGFISFGSEIESSYILLTPDVMFCLLLTSLRSSLVGICLRNNPPLARKTSNRILN
jgi:hypothetical protein